MHRFQEHRDYALPLEELLDCEIRREASGETPNTARVGRTDAKI